MKHIKTLLILIVLIALFLTLSVSAHSGRTDGNGGHHDSITGEYHYHCGGHPAHQHANGICPYDNSIPTGNESQNDSEVIKVFIFFIVVGIIVILFLIKRLIEESKNKTASLYQKEAEKYKSLYLESLKHSDSRLEDKIAALEANLAAIRQEKITLNKDFLNEVSLSNSLKENIAKLERELEKEKERSNLYFKMNDALQASAPNQWLKAAFANREHIFFSPQYPLRSYLDSIFEGRLNNANKSDLSIEYPLLVISRIHSGKNCYQTTMFNCTCKDFQYRKKPCKHMIFLAKNVGTLYAGGDQTVANIDQHLLKITKQIDHSKK